MTTQAAAKPEDRIRTLALSFPCLRKAPGIQAWDALTVDLWAATGIPSHGELCTTRLVLAVWDPDEPWRCGRFDVMDALRVWDQVHRQAFLAWASDPWWP